MTVRFENVSYRYPGTSSGVSDIDIELKKGEILVIIGPSGSGKSTILKLLAGFIRPDQGRIMIDDTDVSDLSPRDRDLGVVFQSYALFPHMNAWQNVAYPLKVRNVAPEDRRLRAQQAIANVGLADFADRFPATLSGGQQQRVALARALVFEPRALLLDEPLSALDPALRGEMRDEILRVQQQANIATLHVTHDQEEALSLGHRVAVMHSGRILQVATPRALYDHPASRTVAAFVGQANLWPGRVDTAGSVRTPLGLLECRSTQGFAAGDETIVLVRPEYLIPHDTGDESDNANFFNGDIVRDRFLGSLRRYDFKVGDVIVRGETNGRGAFSAVSIPPDAVRLLPPETQRADLQTKRKDTCEQQ